MSTITVHEPFIAYELIEDEFPEVTVIEFLHGDILGPHQARELREQLEYLMSSGVPRNVVIDFAKGADAGKLGVRSDCEVCAPSRKSACVQHLPQPALGRVAHRVG